MPHADARDLLSRSKAAWENKFRSYERMDESWRYTFPNLNPYRSGYDPESTDNYDQGTTDNMLFDSTAPSSLIRVINGTIADVMPPGRTWAKLNRGPYFGRAILGESEESEKEKDDINKDIQRAEAKIYQALHASNIQLAVHSMGPDCGVTGTGAIKITTPADSDTLLSFEAYNQAGIALEEGPSATVHGVMRKAKLPRSFIAQLWPGGDLPPVEDTDKQGNPRKWKVHDCTYYDYMAGKWYYDVIVEDDGSKPKLVFQDEYMLNPWIIWRYFLHPNEVQGYSPIQMALPDIRTVNHSVMTRLESASLRVAGLYTFKQSSLNPDIVQMRSGELIPVQSNDPRDPTIAPLSLAGDVNMGELVLQDHREMIKATLMDISLPDVNSGIRSATEIAERMAEAQRLRGLAVLRFKEEVLRPVLRLAAYHLQVAGQLEELDKFQEPFPEGSEDEGRTRPLKMDGRDIELQFTSPLAQSQNAVDAANIVRWAEQSKIAAGEDGWRAGARTMDIPAALAPLNHVPQVLVREEEEERQAIMDAQTPQPGMQPQPGEPV